MTLNIRDRLSDPILDDLYSREVVIDNRDNSSDLENYQILVEIDDNKLLFQSEKGIRFVDENLKILDYWEKSDLKEWVEVTKVVGNKATSIKMLQKEGLNSASDGDETFEFFDDFRGTSLDVNKWDEDAVNDITHEVNDSFKFKDATKSGNTYWIYNNTDTGSQHQAKWTPISSFVLEYESKISDVAVDEVGEGGIALIGSDDKITACVFHADGWNFVTRPIIGYGFVEGNTGSTIFVSNGDERNFRYIVDNNSVKIYQKPTNAESWVLYVDGVASDIAKIALAAGAYGSDPYLDYVEITNVRARKYTSPEPTVVIT